MSKPALGRGLGSLLASGAKPEATEGSRPEVASGVAALIQGARIHHKGRPETARGAAHGWPDATECAAHRTVWRGLLVGADLLLCLLAFLLVKRVPVVESHELLLCAVSILLGAVLSCAALTYDSDRRPRHPD